MPDYAAGHVMEQGNQLPLISVIVPVYNGEKYLAGCIESIEAQTYAPLEILVINDGSTDGTAQVCTALMERYPNIRVITMEDEGVSAARNAGMAASKGAFVTFVDADDRLRPKTLEILYRTLHETGSDIAGCGFYTWETQEQWDAFLNERIRLKPAVCYSGTEYLREELLEGNSRCWSKLYRRALIGKIAFRNGLSIGEDMLFLEELLPYVRKIAEIDYPGYGYYRNPKGAMNRPYTSKYLDQIVCWELVREKAVEMDSQMEAKVTAHLMIGIMLTASKLAMLPAKERRKFRSDIHVCKEKLAEALAVSGAFEQLPRDYQTKVKVFGRMPGVYMALYHLLKRF